MSGGRRLNRGRLIVGLLLAVCAMAALVASGAAGKKDKVRSPGKLLVATQGYTLDKVDDRTRMTVLCPGSKEPYGGGLFTSPLASQDGQGVYPNSYERLGQQGGYHITAALINPANSAVVPRSITLQVVCGKKIGPVSDPHVIEQLGPGDGPKTLIAKCPKKQTLLGGGYQRSNGVTKSGVVTTESHRTSARTWQVVASNIGGFAGEAVSIGYCIRSKKPIISEVSDSVTIATGTTDTAATPPCPAGRQLLFSGFSTPPNGDIRFLGEWFNQAGGTSATGHNSGPPATLTAYSYCVRG